MLAPTAARSIRASLARPALAAPLRCAPRAAPRAQPGQLARRWNSGASDPVNGREGPRGGKSKLIFRFGLKDIPVELYPMGFVVSVAVVGGLFGTSGSTAFSLTLQLRVKPEGNATGA